MSGVEISGSQHALRRDQRLHGPRIFAKIRRDGGRRVSGTLIMNWLPVPPGGKSMLGVVTSRRIGGSVIRSRARRLLREAFRQEQKRLNRPVALVLVARQSIVGQRQPVVARDLRRGFRDAGFLSPTSEPPSSSTCAPPL